jgi:hypothetical protein
MQLAHCRRENFLAEKFSCHLERKNSRRSLKVSNAVFILVACVAMWGVLAKFWGGKHVLS